MPTKIPYLEKWKKREKNITFVSISIDEKGLQNGKNL
jgi:hypothetical protein